MGNTGERTGVPAAGLVKAVIGYGGLAMCLTLVYLGMRAVMDIGGACADGGPYVSAQSCPEGSTIALMGGIFAGIGFGFLATIGGLAVGGIWSAAPLLAWSGLFGSLGWNFLDYGVFNADPQYGIDIGWAICGVLFWIMAFGPLLALVPVVRSMRRNGGGGQGAPAAGVTALKGQGQAQGQGQAPTRPLVINTSGTPVTTVSRDGTSVTYTSTVLQGDEVPEELREQLEALGVTLARARASGQTEASHKELTEIAADFGAAINAAVAATPIGDAVPPVHPVPPVGATGESRPEGRPGSAAEPEFTEGTQALLDRLERLADMRDRGLLAPDEYETAKDRIMAELEGRK